MTRNQRRRAAKARLLAKSERIAKAHLATVLDATRDKVCDNLSSSRPERAFVRSSMGSLGAKSHRGYVCNNQSLSKVYGLDDRGRIR